MSNRRSLIVYIAGAYRAPTAWGIEQNIRAAEYTALRVWKSGFTAICPHANTAHFTGELPSDAWLEGDKVILSRCDAVLMLPFWQQSEGATAEKVFAESKNIPVFSSILELEYFATQREKNGTHTDWMKRTYEP